MDTSCNTYSRSSGLLMSWSVSGYRQIISWSGNIPQIPKKVRQAFGRQLSRTFMITDSAGIMRNWRKRYARQSRTSLLWTGYAQCGVRRRICPAGTDRPVERYGAGLYALGNHELDYMENGHPDLIEELENAGAVFLDKNYVDIEINETKVRLGGLYDYAFGLNDNNDAMSAPADIRSFLQDFQNTDSLKIMLSHRPGQLHLRRCQQSLGCGSRGQRAQSRRSGCHPVSGRPVRRRPGMVPGIRARNVSER